MSLIPTPGPATRLLEAFGMSEALIGDLCEEYQCRKSSFWYWQQTVKAIAVSTTEDIRNHKLLALRGVLAGWAVLLLWAVVWSLPGYRWLNLVTDPWWLAYTRYPVAIGISAEGTILMLHPLLLLTMCLVAMVSAGLVGWLSRPRTALLTLFLVTLLAYSVFAYFLWVEGLGSLAVFTFTVTHGLAFVSAVVAGLWSLPMRENQKQAMPRALVYGGWAVSGLGVGVLALGLGVLSGQVEVIPSAEEVDSPAPVVQDDETKWIRIVQLEDDANVPPGENESEQPAPPPVISPDDRWIAYVIRDGEVEVLPLPDGGVEIRTDVEVEVQPGDDGDVGRIIYYRTSDEGGEIRWVPHTD